MDNGNISYHRPDLAWDQFMVLFDYQGKTGVLPDSINDREIIWNFCKPPIHGWALRKMMQVMTLTKERMAEAYTVLSKWTHWLA